MHLGYFMGPSFRCRQFEMVHQQARVYSLMDHESHRWSQNLVHQVFDPNVAQLTQITPL